MDKSDLYRILNEQNDLTKIKEVERILREQYGKIEEQENLSEYHQKLKNLFYDVVMDDEKGMTLDQIFVDPTFSIFTNSFKRDDVRIADRHKEFLQVDPRYKLKEFTDEVLKCENHLSLAGSFRMLLILGYPGQGKSSFCKKFLNEYILAKRNIVKNVYYFTLRNVRQVRDFIFNPLNTLYEEACLAAGMELNKFEFNKAVLVLDGLDELYMRENLKLDEIDKLCKELSIIVEKHPELFLILTSRYGYVDLEKIYKEKIIITQLEPFSLELQNEWIHKFTKFHPETWLTSNKLMVFNTEHKFKHLKELIEQPLLLHMIATVKDEIDEKTNRAKIYSQLFTELIERKYSKEGQLEIFQKVTKEDLRDLIREIAFGIFQTGNEYITKTELFKLEATQNFIKLFPEENLRDSIKGVMISFYFKEVEKAKDDNEDDKSNFAVEFLHKSLREYLTAEKIYYTLRVEFLERRSSGKYFIDDSKSALEIIFSLLHKQDLSDEIIYHLREIISNDEHINKELLCDRLCYFIEDFSKCDFYLSTNYKTHIIPSILQLGVFIGFWNVVSALGVAKNYLLNEQSRVRIAELLQTASASEIGNIMLMNFNFQDFTGTSFSNCNFYQCSFENTILNETEFYNSRFVGCRFKNTNLNNVYFDECKFNQTEMDTITLNRTFFIDIEITNCYLVNLRFNQVRFENLEINDFEGLSEQLKLENLEFVGVEMDEESYDIMFEYYPNIQSMEIERIDESEPEF